MAKEDVVYFTCPFCGTAHGYHAPHHCAKMAEQLVAKDVWVYPAPRFLSSSPRYLGTTEAFRVEIFRA